MSSLDLRQLDEAERAYCEIVLVNGLVEILENYCFGEKHKRFVENILEKIIY